MTGPIDFTHLVILDIAVTIIMAVLAALSARLGEALKIKPVYKLFFVSIGLIVAAAVISLLDITSDPDTWEIIAICLRIGAGIIAVLPCLRYWSWLFAEFFKSRGKAQ